MRQGSSLPKAVLIALATLATVLAFQNCAPQAQFDIDENITPDELLPKGVDHDPLKAEELGSSSSDNRPASCDAIGLCGVSGIVIGKTYTLEKVIVAAQTVGSAPTVRAYSHKAFTLTFAKSSGDKPVPADPEKPPVMNPIGIVDGDTPTSDAVASLSPVAPEHLSLQKIHFSAGMVCNGLYAGDGQMSRLGSLPVASGQLSLKVTAQAVPATMGCGFKFSEFDQKLLANDGYKHLLESSRAYVVQGERLYVYTNIVGVTAVFAILRDKPIVEPPLPILALDGKWIATSLSKGCHPPKGWTPDQANYPCPELAQVHTFTQGNSLLLNNGKLGGRAACNTIGGAYSLSSDGKSGTQVRFKDIISTMMACDQKKMAEERLLIDALLAARKVHKLADHAYELVSDYGDRLLIKRVSAGD